MSVQSEVSRREPRRKVFFPAAITCARLGTRRVHVLDLSSGGARLHADLALSVGQTLVIEMFDTKHCAHVAWLNSKQAGIVFTFALAPAELAEIDGARAASLKREADRLGVPLRERVPALAV